ncbi:MAG TPA: ABC transporter permease [Gemmatimonadaceae bacterium]|nr:ABC transporter permease [Gemmatimonadaceae bacterium]
MNLWRSLSRGLRVLGHRAATDEQISNEVDHYVDLAAAEHVRRGLAPDAARRAARLEVGNPTVAREAVRAYGWENAVESVAADVRFALRRLRHNPSFAVVTILTLALGIGATTTIFSAVYPVLLAPLPYPDGSQLVTISDRRFDGSPAPATYGTYSEIAARARSFSLLAAADRWQPTLTGTNEPERLSGQRVTASYFATLGVRPVAGRTFTAEEDRVGGPRVVVVSDRLVRRRFAGENGIVGSMIRLDDENYLVVGVMPAGFVDMLAPTADAWMPMQRRAQAPFNSVEWGHHYRIVGRLRAGVSPQSAAREVATIGQDSIPEFVRPIWAHMAGGMLVRPLRDDITHDARPALIAVIGAVLLLLAIACVNVTNLLLAQRGQRRGELAMRTALGAGQSRLVRQQVTECLALASIGGVAGLALATAGVRALVALAPATLPRVDAIRLDAGVFTFALGATTLVGLLIGFSSVLDARTGRAPIHERLQQGSRRSTGGRVAARRALVAAEVALAIVLLASAGLLMRSMARLFAIDPGFNSSHLLTLQVAEAGHAYESDTARMRFFDDALDAVRHLPGVRAAAFTSQLPLSDQLDGYGYELQSKPSSKPGENGSALRYAVTPGYFQAMGIPLRDGRYLDADDRPGYPEAVVISESLARLLFGDRNPIGERMRFGPEAGSTRPWDEIVGVVGDVKQQSLAGSETDAFYVAIGQWGWVDNVQSIVVRTANDAAALAPTVERAIWSVDGNQPIQRVATMDRLIATTAAQRRFTLAIIEAFAVAALVLAAIGLYGVISGSVSERTREIGIRVALGATATGIVVRVVGGALALAGIGIAVGLVGAGVASRFLETMLFSVSPGDPATYVAVTLLLVAVAALASWLPAVRASRVDPVITLRAD